MSDRHNESTAPKASGYSASGNDDFVFDYGIAATYGYSMLGENGLIVEIGDEENDRYLDGMAELRRLKRKGVPGYG